MCPGVFPSARTSRRPGGGRRARVARAGRSGGTSCARLGSSRQERLVDARGARGPRARRHSRTSRRRTATRTPTRRRTREAVLHAIATPTRSGDRRRDPRRPSVTPVLAAIRSVTTPSPQPTSRIELGTRRVDRLIDREQEAVDEASGAPGSWTRTCRWRCPLARRSPWARSVRTAAMSGSGTRTQCSAEDLVDQLLHALALVIRSSCWDVTSSERRPSETNWIPTTSESTPSVRSGRRPIAWPQSFSIVR